VKFRPRVFITDGSYPNAVAAIRALGRDGSLVTVGERDSISAKGSIGFWSRYCSSRFRYPDPERNRNATVDSLKTLFSENEFDAVIPIGLQMTELFVLNGEHLPMKAMLPPRDSFEIAADKRRTFEFAKNLGVRIPATVPACDYRSIPPPCVFKHPRTGAEVAYSTQEAKEIAERLGDELCRYIVQAFIPGCNGFGYFGFYVAGREQGFFMHERLMQFPIEGGPSVEARSIYDPELRELGKLLLSSLGWHGVAMVEFKRSDADGKLYLMEINPKFWGSLDLAIQAGCNFPLWMQDHILGRQPQIPTSYESRVAYQWVVPNGIKCFLRYPRYRWPFLRHLVNPHIRRDMQFLDPLPTFAGLAQMIGNFLRP